MKQERRRCNAVGLMTRSQRKLIARFVQLGLLTDIFFYTPNLLPSTVISIDEGFILGEGSVLCSQSQKLFSLQKTCIYIAQPHQYHTKPCVAMAWMNAASRTDTSLHQHRIASQTAASAALGTFMVR